MLPSQKFYKPGGGENTCIVAYAHMFDAINMTPTIFSRISATPQSSPLETDRLMLIIENEHIFHGDFRF